MDVYAKKRLKVLLGLLSFAACVALIIIGQQRVGWGRLGVMILGLCGIMVLLYVYNRGVEKPKPEGAAKPEEKTPEV